MERVILPREPLTPRRARHYLAPRLSRLGMSPDAAEELLVAVGEAVTNAVVHGAGTRSPAEPRAEDGSAGHPPSRVPDGVAVADVVMVELIARGDRVAVAVTSPSPRWRVPAVGLPDPLPTGGRGLFLMRRLADSVRIDQGWRGTTVYLIRLIRRVRPDDDASGVPPRQYPAARPHGRRRAG